MSEPLKHLQDEFGKKRIESAIERVATLPVEVPSWGFGRGGTRFGSYPSGVEPTTPAEKIEAAGKFYKLTGKGKTVALHFPWDGSTSKDVRSLKSKLRSAGIDAGSINSNLFSMRENGPLDSTIRFGTLTHPDKIIRNASIQHNLDCIDYMRILGSDMLVVWLPDGTNSPGQMSLYDQADRLDKSLSKICKALGRNEKLLIEYKLFEPAFYSTAIQDYARSLDLCNKLGVKANVLVDLGHHAHGVNVEQIVAHLLRRNKLGGFHFNDSFYADDDLATGSIHPHQVFRIFCTLVEGEQRGYKPVHDLALMIDQSHNVKDPFEELIESVENIEIAYAKSLMVDFNALSKAQDSCDPQMADRILGNAFNTDVRPILIEARLSMGLPADPMIDARETGRSITLRKY